jgi:hypothetical protein
MGLSLAAGVDGDITTQQALKVLESFEWVTEPDAGGRRTP